MAFLALGAAVKVAVTDFASYIVTLQGVLVQAPLQSVKVDVLSGEALRSTKLAYG